MGKIQKLEMDDFGDLLDELEGELTSAPVGRAPPPGSMSLGQPQCGMPSNKSAGGGDDLDDLLGDFDCAELKCASPAQKVVPVVLPSSSGPPGSKQKCGTVYMGGANDGMGYQDCVGTVCCNKLRCHSCDFPVVVWDNYEWDASADYIFMRYNYPDWEKLQPKLMPRTGVRAYGCGCSWRSVRQVVDITANLSEEWKCREQAGDGWHQQNGWWVCGGHLA